jgi:hypothetical protein
MSAAAGIDVGGAHHRLLPETIPLRFFGTAVLSHAVAWAGVVIVADALPLHQGGPGPVAAAFHVLTVGVLLATAMGASLQMLPVALGRAAPATWLCNAVYVLLILGGIALVCGFAASWVEIIAIGAGLLALAATVYAAVVAAVLWAAPGLRLVRAHVWAALGCLGAGLVLALLLALDYGRAFLPDHAALAVVHMTLVAYGFLGILALGLSQILIPMFAITEPAEGPLPLAALVLGLAGVVTAVAALLAGEPGLVAAGAALGLAALGCHVGHVEAMLARRMRRRLGGEFQLIRGSWLMLAPALVAAAGLALDLMPETVPALFGFLTLFGWLLSLVMGVQSRILPFLGSMHVLRGHARPVAPTKLVDDRCLRIHRWCHFGAIVLVAAGITADQPTIIRLGGSAGFVGALAYGLFAITVFRRTRHHLQAAAVSAARTTS